MHTRSRQTSMNMKNPTSSITNKQNEWKTKKYKTTTTTTLIFEVDKEDNGIFVLSARAHEKRKIRN